MAESQGSDPVLRVPAAAHTPAYGEVDLTSCDTEPIHVPGAIQPHGVLLALDDDMRVVVASANVDDMLGLAVEGCIGLPAEDLLGPALAEKLGAEADPAASADMFVARLPLGQASEGRLRGRLADVRTHRSGERLVVELEEAHESVASGVSLRSSHGAMSRLAAATSTEGLASRLATELRSLLGFDRVMVYRFDEDWHGEVIAEDRREDLNAFLGLHYPATDIPAQARRLYAVSWVRLIADVLYAPVPLHPLLDPGTGAPLDLSMSSLRSVSPIHIEYLGHMGVTASMSISLMVNEQLWGLVACHHYSGPHRPSQEARAAAELVGQVASQMISDREQAERREVTLATRSRLVDMVTRVADAPGDALAALVDDRDLMPLFDATGVACYYAGELLSAGEVLPEEDLRRVARLLEDEGSYVTASDSLVTLDPDLGRLRAVAAGALRVGSAPDRWLLWLRPEQQRSVDWGGDPTNKLLAGQEGPHVRLSPRRSFDKWREVVRGRSLPWTTSQLEAAELLGTQMQGVLLSRSREQIAMAQSMQRSVVFDRAPHVEGIEVAALYQPASSYQLGGDWWDAFDLGGQRIAFVIGDVAGHGVSAASAMVQIRTSLRAYLFEGHDAATCLDYLDAFMYDLMPDQVASAVVVILDRVTGRLEVASAGHPPPLVLDEEGARLLDLAPRPLLGVGVGPSVSTELELAPDAALLLYTDGLVERRTEPLDDGLERLTEAARSAGGLPLEQWIRTVVESLDVVGSDDTTLLALRRPSP